MLLEVWRGKEGITVNCQMRAKSPGTTFALAGSMAIDELMIDGNRVAYSFEPFEESPLPQPVVKIVVENDAPGDLTVRYRGALSGVFRYDRPDVLHFSFYNAWYPFLFDAETDCRMVVHADNAWKAACGTYDAGDSVWQIPGIELAPQIMDCNVLMIKKDAYGFLEGDRVAVFLSGSIAKWQSGSSRFSQAYISIMWRCTAWIVSAKQQSHICRKKMNGVEMPIPAAV